MKAQSDTNLAPRAQTVLKLAREAGFALVGIAPAQASDHCEQVLAWLARGAQGEMHYLAEKTTQRLDPRALLPGARSIICVADLYAEKQSALADAGNSDIPHAKSANAQGRIARYAWGDDYHRGIKKRLHDMADALRGFWPDHQFRSGVDTAPILEREHAQRAGLGWVGKHTLLIHSELGSWLLLGEIITTLAIQTAIDAGTGPETDHCGACTRCIDACPTHCITPYQVDARKCISYLTLEHRGLIEPELHAPMGDWIAGCDICQEVCPFNQPGYDQSKQKTTSGQSARHSDSSTILPAYQPRPPAPAVPLLDLLQWDAPTRQKFFQRSALKRLKLEQLRRNALIAAGNYLAGHEEADLRRRVEEIAGDVQESEMVRATARTVLARLAGGQVIDQGRGGGFEGEDAKPQARRVSPVDGKA